MNLSCRIVVPSLALTLSLAGSLGAAERWEAIYKNGIVSPYSQTRHDAVKQIDTKTAKGLKTLWSFLDGIAPRNPLKYDWFVKQGAYEALTKATTKEAYDEIKRLLEDSGHPHSKEAVVYSIIFKIRQRFEKDFGDGDENKINEGKYRIRKWRGVKYFDLILPTIEKVDRKGRRLELIQLAFADSSSRVRVAAIQGFLVYPDDSSVPLLLGNLEKLEKKKDKLFREWVFTRAALETLTGQYFRDDVDAWLKWWEITGKDFSIRGRVKAKKEEEEDGAQGKTRVVSAGGVQVKLNMKVVGEGYPLLVLPRRGLEPDYFRPYFHGVEEYFKVHYVQIPKLEDFQGLKRHTGSNLIVYPTDTLANALSELMAKTGPKEYAVLGHGPGAGTLAMKMVAKFPDAVTHLILINPASSGKLFGKALANVERRGREIGSKELENGAKNSRLTQKNEPEYKPADAAEAGGLGRALGNVRFADPSSPEIGNIQFLYRVYGGSQVLNDRNWSIKSIFGSKTPRLPVMVVMGEQDPWVLPGDMGAVAGFFKGAYVAKFKNSAQYPFMFETFRFTKTLQAWAASKGVESAKPGKKKRSSRKKSGRSVSKKD